MKWMAWPLRRPWALAIYGSEDGESCTYYSPPSESETTAVSESLPPVSHVLLRAEQANIGRVRPYQVKLPRVDSPWFRFHSSNHPSQSCSHSSFGVLIPLRYKTFVPPWCARRGPQMPHGGGMAVGRSRLGMFDHVCDMQSSKRWRWVYSRIFEWVTQWWIFWNCGTASSWLQRTARKPPGVCGEIPTLESLHRPVLPQVPSLFRYRENHESNSFNFNIDSIDS